MRQWVSVAGVALALTGMLSACGSPKSPTADQKAPHQSHHRKSTRPATPPSYTPPSTSVPIQSSSIPPVSVVAGPPGFPTIVHMAMQALTGPVTPYALAPTLTPWAGSGSKVMYYNPTITDASAANPGLVEQYQVTLTTPPSPVGTYSSALYQTAGDAAGAVTPLLKAAGLSFPAQGPAMAIGSGITATSATVNNLNVLGWREGQWSVVVAESHVMPTAEASQIAAFLHINYLPAPRPAGTGVGLIIVQLLPDGVHAQLAWQENQAAYMVETYPATANPVMTALKMVVTMRKYSG